MKGFWRCFGAALCVILVLVTKQIAQAQDRGLGLGGRAHANFTCDLLRGLSQFSNRNLVFSPVGLEAVLDILQAGAEGETRQQIQDVLHVSDDPARLLRERAGDRRELQRAEDSEFRLLMQSQLWVRDDLRLRRRFLDEMGRDGTVGVERVDFRDGARVLSKVNLWVDKATRGMIPRILDQEPPASTELLITNAVYFKARWEQPFNPQQTEERPFQQASGETTEMPFMFQQIRARAWRNQELQAIELPYRDPRFAALLVMPQGRGEPGEVWRRWLSGLEGRELAELRQQLRERQVNLLVPRFRAATQLDPSKLLGRLGMPRVWSGDSQLGGISDSPLQLSRIQQRAMVLFHEDGTEAAAATAALVASSANSVDLVFDRPFLFLLHERSTGQILFAGWLAQSSGRNPR
jgi:serine protease inhibitor